MNRYQYFSSKQQDFSFWQGRQMRHNANGKENMTSQKEYPLSGSQSGFYDFPEERKGRVDKSDSVTLIKNTDKL